MIRHRALLPLAALALASCAPPGPTEGPGVEPSFTYPVTDNETPYSACLRSLAALPADALPVFAVGDVADKTGQYQSGVDSNSTVASQAVAEMVMSALYKTGKTRLAERLDLRIPLAQLKMAEQNLLDDDAVPGPGSILGSDFIVLGALTELNYNIVSQGARLAVSGIGAGGRMVVMNVALDLRVINSRTFAVDYVTSLQKQIVGYEIEANVFRFFGDELVEFDAGQIKNEPVQLGVRSVVEMAVYQIMTDFLGLPESRRCQLVEAQFMNNPKKGEGTDDS